MKLKFVELLRIALTTFDWKDCSRLISIPAFAVYSTRSAEIPAQVVKKRDPRKVVRKFTTAF